jgi:hypothetical protein
MKSSGRFLEPNDRISEVLFGLIMVLTFTGSLSVAEAGRDDVRTMLIGALGCNFAWGLIDAIFYLMNCLNEQGNSIRAVRALRAAPGQREGNEVVADSLPPMVAATFSPADYDSLREKLLRLPEPPSGPRLGRDEWLGALAVFLWVFLSTLPVALPFLFMDDVARAMRMSNAIAVLLLFLTGFAFGRVAGYRPWLTGFGMVVLGTILVAITIALGG